MPSPPPDLPARFLPPPGWTFATMTNTAGQVLRYGHVSPLAPRAHLVIFAGLSEFAEKYFEFAQDCLTRGLAVWIMDWRGQGGSGRYFADLQRRHAVPFDEDLRDAHDFITRIVRPMAGNAPLVLFGHSMGGNLALRYLAAHNDTFAGAALTAPMAGIYALQAVTPWLRLTLAGALNRLVGGRYIAGGGAFRTHFREDPARNIFSHDAMRNRVHNTWCLADTGLQVGSVTYRWIYEALVSCIALDKPGVLESIACPVLIALAGDEHLVDNAAMRRLAAHLPRATVLELPGAYHEIVMESDTYRTPFMAAFDALLAQVL